ncbi:malonic semialdehyde reductase [Herbaspirillum sp. NPDC087042]|uniref:malonic semialdehyde reductase n=1 Tax=Herbaspirillum sp. NPDC087042 TaxID=3364004 RepID=UPI00382FC6F4
MNDPTSLSDAALDQLFLQARSHNGWLPRPVSQAQLQQLYALMKMAPTSANCAPARILFLCSDEARQKLRPALSPGNVDKTMSAPVVAVIGYDTHFYELLPQLFPHNPGMRDLFAGNATLADATAVRNSSLQAAYLMLAARSIGLDVGPMSGFDAQQVNASFFPDGRCRVNLLCNIGYGDTRMLFPRSPRLAFEQACSVL